MFKKDTILSLLLFLSYISFSQTKQLDLLNPTMRLIPEGSTLNEIKKLSSAIVPHPRQLEWQKMELTFFIHFGLNTYTNVEWGKPGLYNHLFNPQKLDARQWAGTIKNAGGKLMLIVAKHHDGFCLWPSKFTNYSISNSPYKNGKGDIIKEAASACAEFGLKFGVYLSPWDMHSPFYGSDLYNDYFVHQLEELLSNYGEISEVWFDGANGEGKNGKKQVYDWNRYFQTIRKLQPNAVIAVMGPDVRWVGTESGYGRDTEWSAVPVDKGYLSTISDNSQQIDNGKAFIPDYDKLSGDFISDSVLLNAKALMWHPSEVDVSIRPGWFYHASEDSLVKSPKKLVDIYVNSVGKNSVLLLNLAPNKDGLVPAGDIDSLMGMRRILNTLFKNDILSKANQTDSLTFILRKARFADFLVLQENIINGQKVESFELQAWNNNKWLTVASGSTIGYKRILSFKRTFSRKWRIVVTKQRGAVEISKVALFNSNGLLE